MKFSLFNKFKIYINAQLTICLLLVNYQYRKKRIYTSLRYSQHIQDIYKLEDLCELKD